MVVCAVLAPGPCLILAGAPTAIQLWRDVEAWPWLLGLLLIDLVLVVVPYRLFRWARWSTSTARVTTASRRR